MLRLRESSLFGILLVVFLISLYTVVPLNVAVGGGNTLIIPSAFTLLVLTPLLVVVLGKRIYKHDIAFLVMMFCLLLLTALLSPGLDFIGQKLLGLAQTMTSLAVAILLLKLLDRVGSSKAAKVLFVFSVVLVVGSFLEVTGLLRAASDSFRELAYSGSFVYEAPLRDASITGFERANFFSSEPSVLAKAFLVFVNSWLLLSYNKRNFLKRNLFVGLLLTSALFVLTGSPVLVVSAAISSVIALTGDKSLWRSLVRLLLVRLLPITVILILVGPIVLMLNPDIVSNMAQRFQNAFSLGWYNPLLVRDAIGLRLILPAITLVAVWSNSSLFGVGISGKEVAASYLNLPILPTVVDYGSNIGFGNNFMAVLSYFGIIGTTLFVALLAWYFRKLKVRSIPLLCLILVAFSFTGGGFEEARFWGYVFLLTWAVKERDEALGQGRPGSKVPITYWRNKNANLETFEQQGRFRCTGL